MTTTDELLAERGKTHGDYAVHAKVTQTLKIVFRQHFVGTMDLSSWEAIDMVFHKFGRICAGDAEFEDHYEDCIGYLTLALNEIRKRKAAANT